MSVLIKKLKTETAHIVRNAYSERCQFCIHGHSYLWEIYISGHINEETGMILDFKLLKNIKLFVDKFDHSMVFWSKENTEIIDFFMKNFGRVLVMDKNPTAENMARLVLKHSNEIIQREFGEKFSVSEVRCWETDTGCGIATKYDYNDNFIKEKLEIE